MFNSQTRLAGLALSAALMLAATGCESVVDCLDNDGPEFVRGISENPVLNQVYRQTLTVSINNEPRDDNFRYRFTFSGDLPAGVSTATSGRNFIIDGTPTETGTFAFTVFVEVDDSLAPSESGLCFYSTSRSFEITVQPL